MPPETEAVNVTICPAVGDEGAELNEIARPPGGDAPLIVTDFEVVAV